MARAGLKKATKMVRGKRGIVRRSYWVKSQETDKSPMSVRAFAKRHGKAWMGAQFGFGVVGGVAGHLAARHLKYGGRGDRAAGRRFLHGLTAGSLGSAVGTTVYASHKQPKRVQEFLHDYGRLSTGGRVAVQLAGTAGYVSGAAAGAYGSHRAHSIFKRRTTTSR